MDKLVQSIFAALGAILGFLFGGLDGALIALVAFAIIDYITGVMVGISKKILSSEVGFKGICKKVCIFLLVGVANVIDIHVIKSGAILRTATAMFYIANEGISILENCGNLGLPIPKKLREILIQLKTDTEEPKAEITE